MRLSIAIAALLVSTAVLAGPARAQDQDLMQFADTNGDGKVTLAEYTDFLAQGWMFIAMGADKMKLADVDPMFKGMFAGVPVDADGNITQAAWMGSAPARFKAADKDGNGTLDSKELNASMGPPQ